MEDDDVLHALVMIRLFLQVAAPQQGVEACFCTVSPYMDLQLNKTNPANAPTNPRNAGSEQRGTIGSTMKVKILALICKLLAICCLAIVHGVSLWSCNNLI
ncbi:unnamed protein product [Fraxinus pennsylvanica]|uniref:Uncharacterized protein n=1 Tax=Fraxinus pennsylvanica TaxID=56036 RepID=A0AAD2E3C3_9LAMI|nr:unnamed protein product [Fraxinus pennsylvanica]